MAGGRPRAKSEASHLARLRKSNFVNSSPSPPALARAASWPAPEQTSELVRAVGTVDESLRAGSNVQQGPPGQDNLITAIPFKQSQFDQILLHQDPDRPPVIHSHDDLVSVDITSENNVASEDRPARAASADSPSRSTLDNRSSSSRSSDAAPSSLSHRHSSESIVEYHRHSSRANSQISASGHVQTHEPTPPPSTPSSPPACHDSGCFSSREIDADTQATNIRARERVQLRRAQVVRTRRRVDESRQDLGHLREKFRNATTQLMKAVDKLMATNNVQDLASLAPYHQKVREAQNELGPAEELHSMLEMKLTSEEEALEEEEQHFYSTNNIQLHLDLKEEELSPLVKPYQPPDSNFRNLNLDNDLVATYVAKVGEAETLKEEIEELENRQYLLIQEEIFRKKHNLQLSEEGLAFIREYPVLHSEATQKLQRTEDELYDLRERCIEEHLFSEADHRYEPRDVLVEEINDEIREANYRNPLFEAVNELHDQGDCHNLVDAWSLQMLTDSSMELLRLFSCIRSEYDKLGKNLDNEINYDWSKLFVELWNTEPGPESEPENMPNSSYDILNAGSFSDQELDTIDWTLGSELHT